MSYMKMPCLVLGVVLVLSCSVLRAAARSFPSTNCFLTLDADQCGFPKSVDGGAITAEVINEPSGPDYFVKKHIGQPKYQEFQVQVGFDMSRKVGEWIARFWSNTQSRTNGSFMTLDDKLQPVFERQFYQALITETTIPALDAASKEPAYLTVKFAPETIRTANPEAIKRVRVELYVERIEFLPEGKEVGPAPKASTSSGATSTSTSTSTSTTKSSTPTRTLAPSAPKTLKRPG